MFSRIAFFCTLILFTLGLCGQSGNSTSVGGVVVDPSGAVVNNANVQIDNPVSAFSRTTTTDSNGRFNIANVPFNPYHLTVRGAGFSPYTQDVEVRSSVPLNLKIPLALKTAATTINVESSGADLTENTPVSHTDVDRGLFDRIPLESASSSVSSLVTLATPGIAADSNGLAHGLGDHAENSFSVDGQPDTDQHSKIFSNQIPLDSVESMEVIAGAPPAEFGDKTSIVIKVTTRSGQGVTTPHGGITSSYGTFGTANVDWNLAYGGPRWGNFIAANGLNSGRFLDPPEIQAIHDRGNEENLFDRVDYQFSDKDTLHLNLGYSRSWFQTPNSYDNLHVGQNDPFGNPLPPTDQRSQIKTFNIAPSWTRLLNANAVFTLGGFVRRDQYDYYPSNNPFADIGPIQQETVGQSRSLLNAGIRSDLSYVKGIHNVKVGVTYQHTFLNEDDTFGIIDPNLLPSLTDAGGNPCLNPAGTPVSAPCTDLAPFDLTRGGSLYGFHGIADVKELALYIQDAISKGNWTFNLGIRGDLYNGLTVARQAEPRVGIAYHVTPSNTVLRVSFARLLETPFNENLVLASTGCNYTVLADLIPCVPAPNTPGYRNEFHAGLEQAFGKFLVVSGDYIWKYTHTGYDFSILGQTPIFFPIGWHNSKITGFDMRVSMPNFHGLTALVVMSSVAARFFPPQTSGLGVTVGQSGFPFRIDHDEKFNQTTHLQYQVGKNGPWVGFNWRYDSGLVAGAVPFATDNTTPVDLTGLTADLQMQAGLFCGNVRPTLTMPLTTCAPSQYGSTLISIPAPGTENDDHNPPRVAPRNLFDLAVGDDNLFRSDRYKWSLRLSAINIANKVALYNFLSTFSGTHYVSPRALTAELGFHF